MSETIAPIEVLDFWAVWCGPCKQQTPIVEKLAEEMSFTLTKINVDETPEIAKKYGVQSIPTLIVVRGDKEIGRQVGLVSAHRLKSIITLLMGKA